MSCNKIELASVSYDFNFGDDFVVLDDSVKSKAGNTVRFVLETVYLKDHYVFGSDRQGNWWIDTAEFFNGQGLTYSLDSLTQENPPLAENYSLVIIWDKTMDSGWGDDYGDGLNYTLKTIIEQGNEVMLLGAVRNGGNTYVEYGGKFFQTYEKECQDEIFNVIADQQEGSTSLYDAINEGINFLNSNAAHNRKEILVFWDNDDDSLGISADSLISRAKQNDVHINFNPVDHNSGHCAEPGRISLSTGGYHIFGGPHNDRSTTSFYCDLYSTPKLLQKNYTQLNFHIRITAPWVSNTSYWWGSFNVDYIHSIPYHFNYE